MTRVRDLRILSRDPDLVPRGYLPWRTADITLRWLYTSSWELTLPATEPVRDKIGPGWGIQVVLDGEQVLSGSVEDAMRERSAEGSPAGTVTITGADDLAIVAGELAYPDPASAATGQALQSHDSRSGVAETVIKGYVDANVGDGRAAARRDASAPNVREPSVAADQARGDTVSYKARFTPLMELIRQVHGGLGVTCYQDGPGLVFDVVEPTDRSSSATFSFEAGNLTSARWSIGHPEVTHVVIAGQGEGTARTFRQRTDSAVADDWRMAARTYLDQRHTDTAAELDQAGDEELDQARRTGILEATLIDTARLAYGRDYQLGDRVTISPEPGVLLTDVITAVRIQASADSGDVTITPTIGWDAGPYETRQERRIRRTSRRVSNLERSV